MKAIVNYIKEAFITKANIKAAAAAQDHNDDRFDVTKLSELPEIKWESPNEVMEKIGKWIQSNDLFPRANNIMGRSGEWVLSEGAGVFIGFGFKFDNSAGGPLRFFIIDKTNVTLNNYRFSLPKQKTTDIDSLLKNDKQLNDDINGLITCLKYAMGYK